jgi:uncharacterized repeat protein (TIGR03803 family)
MIKVLLAVSLQFVSAAAGAQVKVYGTTTQGGDSSAGVIFSINSDGSGFQRLYSFKGGLDGVSPEGPLATGGDTKLYGLTASGGVNNGGTVYAYDTMAHTYQKLGDLSNGTGTDAAGGLLWFDNKLYGLAVLGGANGNGTIFTYDPVAGTVADVYDLTAATGAQPFGSLTLLNNLMYFTTNNGGSNNGGVLNVYDPSAGTVSALYNFPAASQPSGPEAWSNLTVMNNILYGTETLGGSNFLGLVYSYDPAGAGFKDLWDYAIFFNGVFPYGVVPFHGLLYGTTANGGMDNNGGTIGYVNPTTGGHSQLYAFDFTNNGAGGAYPYSTPVITADGLMLGMTQNGGVADSGIIYSFDLTTSTFTKLMDFTGTNGALPVVGRLLLPGTGVPLPIRILRFSGVLADAGRVLNWTASETAGGGWFQLERSVDEVSWGAVDSVGASVGTGSYSYTDDASLPGVKVLYYRLKMTDESGVVSYSQIVAIGLGGDGGDGLRLINTAVYSVAFLQYTSSGSPGAQLNVRVVGMNGAVWIQTLLPVAAGVNSYTIDAAALPKGMYVLQAAGRSIKFERL